MNCIKPAKIFQSNMILQRDKPIHIWGEGPDGVELMIQISNYSSVTTIRNNRWSCVLPSLNPCTGQTITIHCERKDIPDILLQNISIGDVWVAGGQSNMEYFLRYDSRWEGTKKLPLNPYIHMYNCPRLAFEGHEKNTSDSDFWFGEGDAAWETFSAPGYAFARAIQPQLNIPIGIIGCNWGGTTASTWMDEAYLESEPLSVYLEDYENALIGTNPDLLRKESLYAWNFEDNPKNPNEWDRVMYGLDENEQEQWLKEHADDPIVPMGPYHKNRPGGLFHQMLEKIAPFPVKGILWYQGESDAHYPHIYDKLFTSMIECWRNTWNDPELPFLFVQLAPFGKWLDCSGDNYQIVREKQELVAKTLPNTAMISIMDLGMYEDIHPKRKMEVGERLALLARGTIYGEDILCQSPELSSAKRNQNTISLSFVHTGEGLSCQDNYMNGLEIFQKDEKLTAKNIRIDKNRISLDFDNLSDDPCNISFAEVPYVEVNVFNSAGLPLKPFHLKV